MIYFDNAATTFPKPELVYQALDRVNRTLAFNAGRGESAESELAMKSITEARAQVASFVPGSLPSHVVFTSSATEALNEIILGLNLLEGETVYISPFEHNAIVRPLAQLKKRGINIEVLPFDHCTWQLDVEGMKQMFLLKKPRAVFVSQISNVTGYALPYNDIFEASQKYDAVNVLDAAQGFGVFPITDSSHCSYIIFDGHKSLYASFGVGGFVVVRDHHLIPVLRGGTGSDSLNPEMPEDLPGRYEAGSQNVVAIASLIASIQWLKTQNVAKHEIELTSYFRQRLTELACVKIFCPDNVVSHGIVSLDVEGYSAGDMGILLSNEGISVRTGYHCAPLIHSFIGSLPYQGTVRFSFGAFNKKDEIDIALQSLKNAIGGVI